MVHLRYQFNRVPAHAKGKEKSASGMYELITSPNGLILVVLVLPLRIAP